MRIYSNKTYIVYPAADKPFEPSRQASVVTGVELRSLVKGNDLQEGDTVYEATEFARVKEKKTVELFDVAGDPVEDEAE